MSSANIMVSMSVIVGTRPLHGATKRVVATKNHGDDALMEFEIEN